MFNKDKNERELVTLLARPIVPEVAPAEQDDFDDLVEDYFEHSKGSDLTLGAGLDLWPDMAYVLFFMTHVLSVLVRAIQQRSGTWFKWRVRKEVLAMLRENAEQLLDPFSPQASRYRKRSLPSFSGDDVESAIASGRDYLSERVSAEDFAQEKVDLLADWTRSQLLTLLEFKPVDLALRVTTRTQGVDTCLDYELHSPSGVAPFHHVLIPGHVLKGKPEILFQRVEEASCASAAADELVDLGRNLYSQLFPSEMRAAYRDIPLRVKTLQITSDEPWIPWEILKPYDDSDPKDLIDDDFLCAKFQLTRWLAASQGPPIVIGPGRLLAVDAGGAFSHEECQAVTAIAGQHSEWVDVSPQQPTAKVTADLLREGVDLFHFVGRGHFKEEQPDDSPILFSEAGNEVLRPRSLEGPLRSSAKRHRPLVFFHVQEAARQGWSLVDLAGWPARWVRDCSCGAFIAPHWDVDRELALSFAQTFYAALKRGETIGAAVQKARQRLRADAPGSPTWLSYVVYAHPDGRLLLNRGVSAATDTERSFTTSVEE